MKLLIVDDDAGIRQLISVVLAAVSPEIAECADGADALSAYETHRPDVVLMDIAMAHVDGLAATASITAAHPDARVVIVSNHDEPDLRAAAHQAGACGYVVKRNLLDLVPLLKGIPS
jgi:DNA-binding NarL/FixJ family response regulator